MVNAKNGYSSPDEPEKKHLMTPSFKVSTERKEIKEEIELWLNLEEPENRDEVIEAINSLESVEVARVVTNSISIKVDGQDKNIRLTGAYFEQGFRADKTQEGAIRERQEEYRQSREGRHREHFGEYNSRLQRAGAKNREKYDRISRNIEKRNKIDDKWRSNKAKQQIKKVSDLAIGPSDSNGFDYNNNGTGGWADSPENIRNANRTSENEQESRDFTQNGYGASKANKDSPNKAKETEEKIKVIFNEQRTDDKTAFRGFTATDKAFEEIANQSAGNNRKSAGNNRCFAERTVYYARSLKQNIDLIVNEVGGWAEKRMQIMRKKNHEKAKNIHKKKIKLGLER